MGSKNIKGQPFLYDINFIEKKYKTWTELTPKTLD